MLNKTESDFVKPFYRKMMGLAALRLPDEIRASVVTAAGMVTVSEVNWMLRVDDNWRPVVMGAWFSLAVPAEPVRDALLAAMSQSRGSLTAPPLAAAATILGGPAAAPFMTAYLEYIMARPDGSEDVVAAAVEYLDAEPPFAPTDQGRRTFHALVSVAMGLRDELGAH